MPPVRPRSFSPEFKLKVMQRLESGEVLSALAEELGVHRQLLYKWRNTLRRNGGSFPRRGPRRGAKAQAAREQLAQADPLAAANRRIAELERKVGQQQLELDFFQQTLRRFKEPRPANSAPGVNVSSPRSKR
ncbi:MAG TPA: transposase [Caulobacteraceae bacterium]|jgi:transposase-like protein|nr:transposase [Caulobacteraceae bacterium]